MAFPTCFKRIALMELVSRKASGKSGETCRPVKWVRA